MAEVVGLVLGVVGIAGLFSTCIECFDIVITGKDFSEDYEQLCALLSVQRLRFCLWGQSVGLVPNPSSGFQRLYDQSLDQPDVRPSVERILLNIKTLLDGASQVDERYREQLETSRGQSTSISSSRGLNIFKGQFERFTDRIRKHQQTSSPWKVARWAVHDARKFEEIINRLEKFVDGLEAITKSLQSLTDLHAQLQEEVEEISDVQDLKLLRDASSSHRSSSHSLSGSSSRPLIKSIAESVLEQQSLVSRSTRHGTSFVTANVEILTIKGTLRTGDIRLPGAYPDSLGSKSSHSSPQVFDKDRLSGRHADHRVMEANEKSKENNTGLDSSNDEMLSRLLEQQITIRDNIETRDVPQNQRLLRDLLSKSEPRKPLSFAAGDANYGQNLTSIKVKDEESWLGHSPGLLVHAESSSSAAKRMFLELRDIRTSKVPFISAAPLGDSLDKVLASIEGPPETPYEGGIFWITVQLPRDPRKPPLLRFQTKIYHPNISPQGQICADYEQKWNTDDVDVSKNFWYRRKRGDIIWSLGGLLIALCGLLAAPDVDDPLVPEIAQTYVKDHEAYWQAAKIYTERYALPQRPDDSTLVFLEDLEDTGASLYKPPPPKPNQADTISMRPSLNSAYGEPYPDSEFDFKPSSDMIPRREMHEVALANCIELQGRFDHGIYSSPEPSPSPRFDEEQRNKLIHGMRQRSSLEKYQGIENSNQNGMFLDAYTILGVTKYAMEKQIFPAYSELRQELLCSRRLNIVRGDISKLFREPEITMQAAYEILTCKVWREEYDSMRLGGREIELFSFLKECRFYLS